jgi:hypothetical protein
MANILACVLSAVLNLAQTEPVSAAGTADAPAYPEVLLRQVPRTDKDAEDRLAAAKARMADLRLLLDTPPTEGVDEAAAAVRIQQDSAYRAWESYVSRLNRFKALKASIANLTSPEHLATVTEQMARLQRETDELSAVVARTAATDAHVQAVEEAIAALQASVNTLSETQTGRSQALAAGFQQRQGQLEAELQQRRAEKEALKTRADAAPGTAPPEVQAGLRLERERVDVQLSALELALALLPMERQETELLSQQDQRLLEVSRKKLDALNRRLAMLREAQSRSRLEILESQRAQATDPVEVALLDLRLLSERALAYYFHRPEDVDALQRRFPPRALERLTERLALSRAYWDRATGSLAYCSGDETAALEQQLRAERAEIEVDLATARTRLARTMDESQGLQTVRERVRKKFSSGADRLMFGLAAADVQERAQREGEAAGLRTGLEESMRQAIKAWEDVGGRLNEALTGLEQHDAYLQDVGRQLHWKRITSRDPGLIGADWSAARAELAALVRGSVAGPTDTEKAARDAFREDLFGVPVDAGAELRLLLRAGRADLGAASGVDWAWIITALGASLVVGFVVYRLARGRGVRLARDIVETCSEARADVAPAGSGLSKRVNLMALNMLGDLAIPLLVAAALTFGAWRALDDTVVRTAVLTLLAVVAIAITALRLVHHLFEAYSPPHRPLPCSDVVARHYRWWLSMLIVLSLVALPLPLLLRVAGLAPAVQSLCMQVYKTLFLALLLAFLFRKERVLGFGAAGYRHWGMTVAWVLYPLAVICVAMLLVLQLVGFGALVTYVGTGLLVAVGITIALGTVTEYFADIIEGPPEPTAAESCGCAAEAVTETGDLDVERKSYRVKLLRALVRVAGLAATILLILWAWDVPLRAEWIVWRKVGLGLLVVVVALVVDRVAFAALYTLFRSGRVPISTVNIIRRWARGLLVILVLLTIVALAGFKIDSLWTFLTAVLAMVAIGFVAVWSMLSNILATLVILIWRPFNVGERIEVLPEGLDGQVIDINFIYTTLKSDDGKKMAIPNNLFAQKFIRRSAVRGAPKRTLAEQLASDKPLDESAN